MHSICYEFRKVKTTYILERIMFLLVSKILLAKSSIYFYNTLLFEISKLDVFLPGVFKSIFAIRAPIIYKTNW